MLVGDTLPLQLPVHGGVMHMDGVGDGLYAVALVVHLLNLYPVGIGQMAELRRLLLFLRLLHVRALSFCFLLFVAFYSKAD